jgi:hypothetical protein
LIRGSVTVRPQTDIYQLAQVLWRICADSGPPGRRAFCKIASCTTKADVVCTESHTNSVQLPLPNDYTPHYLREVIAACRTESDTERPPAWKLLEMFPPIVEENTEMVKAVSDDGVVRSFGHTHISTEGENIKDQAFQQMSIPLRPLPESISNPSITLEECFKAYQNYTFCDRCREQTREHYFNCNICASANYDLCRRCFLQGAHCLERDHYLREFSGI